MSSARPVRALRCRRVVPLCIALATVVFAGACGDDDTSTPTVSLSTEAAAGRQVALENGCASCHGLEGEGPIAPRWQGLYGSTVELEDGTTVVADDDYLRRAIVDPSAEEVAGYTLQMPKVSLADDQVDALIAYIRELS